MKPFSASDFFDYFSYDDDLLRRIMFLVLLLMPILILVGRSPLDIAASTIAIHFIGEILAGLRQNGYKQRFYSGCLLY